MSGPECPRCGRKPLMIYRDGVRICFSCGYDSRTKPVASTPWVWLDPDSPALGQEVRP